MNTPLPPDQGNTRPRIFLYAVAALIIAAGILRAWGLATVNDDAFISFRYAENLVEGNGLVYNPGERVEGFTNFLWTVMIAAGMEARIDPVRWTIALGIFFYAGTLLLVLRFPRSRAAGGLPPVVPVALAGLVAHRDLNVYATSGLETSMQTFLITAVFVLLARRRDARAFIFAGLLLTAAMMTRPDAVVVLAAVALWVVAERTAILKNLTLLGLPVCAVFVPYWFIRFGYYGYFFPNAFYAKSIALSYWTQGATYLWMYVSSYYPLLLLPLIAIPAFFLRTPEGKNDARPLRLGLFIFAAYALFIVRVGGDFMFARFLIPVTPVAYILLESASATVPAAWARRALRVFIVAGTLLRYDYFADRNQVGYIADEWQRYPPASLSDTRKNGALLRRYFDGLPVRAAFWGGQARLMYYAKPLIAIETMTGLTDTFIAHRPLEERGRPGHEKTAPGDYLVRRGVDFFFRPFEPPPPGARALNFIVFDSLAGRIVTYRNVVMDSLRKFPEVYFRPMPEYLDGYIATLEGKNPVDVARDYAWFREFYFMQNDDIPRERAFTAYLSRHGIRAPGG